MPKETFVHLPVEKKKIITEAIQKAFLEKPIGKISVSDIVKNAEIPRGSFYQYFEDLEDVFHYLLDYSLKAFEEEELSRVKAKQLTFFGYLENTFVNDVEFFSNYDHQKIVARFFSSNHTHSIDYASYLRRRHAFFDAFFSQLDTTELQDMRDEQVMHLFYFITQFKMQMIQGVLKGRLDITAANAEYQWFLRLIKTGLREIDTDA